MGAIYRATYTKPLPADAETVNRKGDRYATWRDKRGRRRTAKITTTKSGEKLLIEAGTYTAKYRDGTGMLRKVSTGCRTRDAAMAVLVELETRADKVRSGKWTAAEDAVLDHQAAPLLLHIEAYLDHLRTKRGKGGKPKVSPRHIANVEHNLSRIVADCKFKHLRDLNRSSVESWIKRQLEAETPLAARTINAYLAALTAFGNWCVETKRLVSNPLNRPPKLDEKADRRRQRRALTDDELQRLLRVARLRPLAEYGRETVPLPPAERKGRRTWSRAPLTLDNIDMAAVRAHETLADRPAFITELKRTGLERALIYKTLLLTGLRKGELASLTIGKLDLDLRNGPTAYAALDAADEKAGKGADVPLRTDLADDLRGWLADRLEAARAEARALGEPLPARLRQDTPLFNVPAGLIRILDRDLAVAGIPKRDERGRTVDVHAMRHTFGTHLSKGGISPRTAQAAMRHSTLDLTMNTYTAPRLLDVAGAMDVLPSLPLGEDSATDQAKATGTDPTSLVPMLVPNPGNQRPLTSVDGKPGRADVSQQDAVSLADDSGSEPLTRRDKKRAKGLEPSTFSLEG